MKTDIEIAQAAVAEDIFTIADKLGVDHDKVIAYGRDKAKLDLSLLTDERSESEGKLVLVTAMSPTPAGEGKTTTTIGLADALHKMGKNVAVAMREPSLGPVFGVKGGAAGGGYAQVIPMEDINLHFTGDIHAIGAANNLLAAMVDNHIKQGNELGIDPRRITWHRCVDMNDRQLRHLVDGMGTVADGMPREDSFDITVASEVMAILCLASSVSGLKERLGNIVVGYTFDQKPVFAREIKAEGAMAALLKDAIKPNLVQTLEHTPVLVHGGPFANIAHGCNSVLATKLAMKLADITVTEAGFGADLGAEKFFDIKCRVAELDPDAVVVVATIRSLKYNGGVAKKDLNVENVEALKAGLSNLMRHIDNIQTVYGLPVVVALNKFTSDTDAEVACVRDECAARGVEVCLSDVWAKGSEGGMELAEEVLKLVEKPHQFSYAYETGTDIQEAIESVAKKVYRADGVSFTPQAQKQIKALRENGFGNLPVCIAKTQYSFSDDQKKLRAPENFSIEVRECRVSAGAGFIVAITGTIMTMPGLPKHPAAEMIDINDQGVISGLF